MSTIRVEDIVPLLRELPPESLEALKGLLESFRPGGPLEFDEWAKHLAKRRGFDSLTENDISDLVHSRRKTA